VIKYLGSKRTLVPQLTALAQASGARTALDLFTGTTRVAQAFKRAGLTVSAVDMASYSEVFARTWISLDGDAVSQSELTTAIADLNATPGEAGYFTKTFCEDSRFFSHTTAQRSMQFATASRASLRVRGCIIRC